MRAGKKPCTWARASHSRQMEDYRKRRYLNGDRGMYTDITGSIRRVQALSYLGYSSTLIAEMLGRKHFNIGHFSNRQKAVWRDTAELICIAYEKYSMLSPEPGKATTAARNYARNRGYVGPLAWDEETIDDPRALPQGIPGSYFRKWLNHNATDLQKQIWQEMQEPEKLSA